jgi:hypothetical protein
MDHETADLIQRLCTKAGMIMEDASVDALMLGATDPQTISARLMRIAEAAEDISTIVAAARVLH